MDADQKTVVTQTLWSFIVDEEELRDCMNNVNDHLCSTFKDCFEACSSSSNSNKSLQVESVLDYLHDELNTGHWSQIPTEFRKGFTGASFIKCLISLKAHSEISETVIKECLKVLDMGILLGAPLEKNCDLMVNSAKFLSQQINEAFNENLKDSTINQRSEQMELFNNIKGAQVVTLNCPSLETFNKYFTSQTPVKLQNCINHWPALSKWNDINYLLKVAGSRTVPVEIGSHYADENWRQKLMTVGDFIKHYFLEENINVGYLAQHNLFDQIPELRSDIYTPEYCCLSNTDDGEDPDVNAWFGPANTVSPLHHDPKNNMLVQIFGTKHLILYSPDDSSHLYPHEGSLLFNTAQVNPFQPDYEKYPNFAKARAHKCLLEAGEMLYIPPKWWHHVTALEKSFSVSFWWN